jgi:hypothetical protein
MKKQSVSSSAKQALSLNNRPLNHKPLVKVTSAVSEMKDIFIAFGGGGGVSSNRTR